MGISAHRGGFVIGFHYGNNREGNHTGAFIAADRYHHWLDGRLICLLARVGSSRAYGSALWVSCAMALYWLSLIRRSGSDGGKVDIMSSLKGESIDPPPVRVDVITQEPGGYIGGQFLDLPAEPGQLITLADGLVNGLSLSEGSWTGSGAPFSRSQFRTLRDALIYSGLARWKDERYRAQGVILSPAGRAVMRRFASMSDTKALPRLEGKLSTIVDK